MFPCYRPRMLCSCPEASPRLRPPGPAVRCHPGAHIRLRKHIHVLHSELGQAVQELVRNSACVQVWRCVCMCVCLACGHQVFAVRLCTQLMWHVFRNPYLDAGSVPPLPPPTHTHTPPSTSRLSKRFQIALPLFYGRWGTMVSFVCPVEPRCVPHCALRAVTPPPLPSLTL
jgi:hypothetical protein